jgi:LytS/YehU family sensor histidine kinase
MIKDDVLKWICIPLLGTTIPYIAGLYSFGNTLAFLFAASFFVFSFFFAWQSTIHTAAFIRATSFAKKNLFYQLSTSLPVGIAVGALLYMVCIISWQRLVQQKIIGASLLKAEVMISIVLAMLILLYEILFIKAEKAIDAAVLQQVDNERLQAEVNVLNNELDPHFFFNCLNTLTQLVYEDKEKAYQFIHKLSNVYRYFLINKEKELVSLSSEIEFLENYYFLLQVRFDHSVRIEYDVAINNVADQILPCTLQALVENAIKHNFFSEAEPLTITIGMIKNQLIVSNPLRPKLYAADSKRIGLRNLKKRYRLILNKDVTVQTVNNKFLVKLPIKKFEP